MLKNIFLTFLLIFIPSSSIVAQIDENRSYREKQRSGDYNPYVKLSDNDTLEWPIKYSVNIIINELRNISTKNDDFYINVEIFEEIEGDTIFTTVEDIEIGKNAIADLFLEHPRGDRLRYDVFYGGKELREYSNDSFSTWKSYFEGDLPHKWELRDFPFDKQLLKLKIRSNYDTSIVRIVNNDNIISKILTDDIDYLREGYQINDLDYYNEFIEGELGNYPDSYRPAVLERLVYTIGIERNSGYLYFKLFFGAILSYIISLLVFFIDKKLFETRITLSLGGIFGAVGNKYFVENTLPELLVLTKADLINNVFIIFIVMNIFIVIAQATKTINLGIFEKNKPSFILSILLLMFFNLVTIYL